MPGFIPDDPAIVAIVHELANAPHLFQPIEEKPGYWRLLVCILARPAGKERDEHIEQHKFIVSCGRVGKILRLCDFCEHPGWYTEGEVERDRLSNTQRFCSQRCHHRSMKSEFIS